jgi:hypothetical protein
MNETSESGEIVIDTTFNERGGKFTATKVPRQCPLVLLVKVVRREGKAFGTGEGNAMRSGARREDEQGLTAFDRSFEF